MARILITGSRGVVATHLERVLREQGHTIFGVDLEHDLGEVGWEHPMGTSDFNYSRCDVADFRHLERVFSKAGPFDLVYHAAAEFGRWNGEDYYEQVWRTNAIGTKNVIRLQEKLGFKLIHFSSSEVYGDFDGVMREEVMEEEEIKQLNDYAISKWANEMQIGNSRVQHKTQSVIVRLFNTYGPGEWYHPYRSVNCKFCYHALHGLPVTVYRGHERTSLYLEDAARTLAALAKTFSDGAVYNIGGTEAHDIETLAELVWKNTGAARSLIRFEDAEILTTRVKKVDCSRAEKDLGHRNSITLADGVKRTIAWMREYYSRRGR